MKEIKTSEKNKMQMKFQHKTAFSANHEDADITLLHSGDEMDFNARNRILSFLYI